MDKERAYQQKYQKTERYKKLKKKFYKKYNPRRRILVAKRKKTDINFKLKLSLSKRVLAAVKLNKTKKAFKTEKLIGCSVLHLRKYLEKKFKKGMTWKNHSRYGWHIDHIRPLDSFDLRDPKQQLIAFNYKNMQPLWAIENLSKSTKY